MEKMKFRGVWCIVLVIVVVSVAAQATESPESKSSLAPEPTDTALVEKAKIAVLALNHFGQQLLAGVAASNRHENVFVSPLSVFVALTMVETGSEGQTRAALRHGLAVPAGISEDTLHQAASALLKSLQSQQGAEFSTASALWSDPSEPLSAHFVEQSQEFYEADARTLDFSAPGAANVINEWVKQKTHDKISSIVTPEVVKASKAMLTNAVYFHGKWSVPFPKESTQDMSFTLASGREKKTPMMRLSSLQGTYRSGDGFEAVVLDYQSSEIKFVAILPAPGKNPEDVLTKLAVKDLLSPSSLDLPSEIDLSLPRFTLDLSYQLKDRLEQMGMGRAFHPGAEFGPMGSSRFFIGDVLHKTCVEVNEEGTVAAAATATGMMTTAMRPRETKTLVFDRPFVVLLYDAGTGAIVFFGLVYDPTP
jgi:serine protease inhibitor